MKFVSEPVREHGDAPLGDAGRLEELVERWLSKGERPTTEDGRNRCFVASIGEWEIEESRRAQLAEILSLVDAQGDPVVGSHSYRHRRPNPKTLIGRGVYEDIAQKAREVNASMVVVDVELSPSQTRNLEEAISLPVCDREAVILNVFLRNARTRKARIQVEIAQLEFLRPRIRGVGLSMDQQAGGVLGSRGPGETASELFSRKIDGRLNELRRAFVRLERAGQVQRRSRDGCARIALVGYTNAGKTTLMNALANAELSAKNRPFETLDTTSRTLSRYGVDVILSDTVGFIRRLPERLLASFESTLAEAREASLLAIVINIADPEWRLHLDTTERVLDKLDLGETERFYIFNKADLLRAVDVRREVELAAGGHSYRVVSGRNQEDVDELREALLLSVRAHEKEATVFVPYSRGEISSAIYRTTRVVRSECSPDGTEYTIAGKPHFVDAIVAMSEGRQS
ncbi:MAG: GTPase HflX [Myxococcota bacterium]